MKKLFAIALAAGLLVIGTQANAQIMPGAGFVHSTISGQFNGAKEDNVNYNGFYAGASYHIDLPVKGLAVTPGAYLSVLSNYNDGSDRVGSSIQTTETRTNEVALNIPVYANFSTYIPNYPGGAFVYLGPTFQMGLSSKSHLEGSGVLETSQDTDYYAENFYNRFDLFLSIGAGGAIGNLLITVGYNQGLLNLYAGDTADTYYHHSNLLFGLNYKF